MCATRKAAVVGILWLTARGTPALMGRTRLVPVVAKGATGRGVK